VPSGTFRALLEAPDNPVIWKIAVEPRLLPEPARTSSGRFSPDSSGRPRGSGRGLAARLDRLVVGAAVGIVALHGRDPVTLAATGLRRDYVREQLEQHEFLECS
jgi:hypothetical protein